MRLLWKCSTESRHSLVYSFFENTLCTRLSKFMLHVERRRQGRLLLALGHFPGLLKNLVWTWPLAIGLHVCDDPTCPIPTRISLAPVPAALGLVGTFARLVASSLVPVRCVHSSIVITETTTALLAHVVFLQVRSKLILIVQYASSPCPSQNIFTKQWMPLPNVCAGTSDSSLSWHSAYLAYCSTQGLPMYSGTTTAREHASHLCLV